MKVRRRLLTNYGSRRHLTFSYRKSLDSICASKTSLATRVVAAQDGLTSLQIRKSSALVGGGEEEALQDRVNWTCGGTNDGCARDEADPDCDIFSHSYFNAIDGSAIIMDPSLIGDMMACNVRDMSAGKVARLRELQQEAGRSEDIRQLDVLEDTASVTSDNGL